MPPNRSQNRRNDRQSSYDAGDILSSGAAKLKKKIRDIERVLKRDALPGKVKNDNERTLQALKTQLENAQLNLKTRKNAKKYHMVRFFEKKKAIRKLKQAKKTYEEVLKTEVRKEIKKARKVVKHCEVDLAYVVSFPLEEKYISLYPNSKPEGELDEKAKKASQETDQRRAEYKKTIEKSLEEGTLPFTIEDILSGQSIHIKQRQAKTQEPDAPKEKSKDNEDEDDFFE